MTNYRDWSSDSLRAEMRALEQKLVAIREVLHERVLAEETRKRTRSTNVVALSQRKARCA